MTYPTEKCRTPECGADIIWARTKIGKLMPVDAEPTSDGVGNVLLSLRQGTVYAEVLAGQGPGLAEEGGALLRTSHFVTCVRAKDWRVQPKTQRGPS